MIDSIVNLFIRKKVVPESEREIYEYGLKMGLIYLINFSIAFVIAFMMNQALVYLMTLVMIATLRRNVGGYHAKKLYRCFLISEIYIVLPIMIVPRLIKISTFLLIIIMGISLGLFWGILKQKGIVLGKHIEKEGEESKYLHKTYIRIWIIFLVAVLATVMGCKVFMGSAIYAYAGQTILLCLAGK